MPVLPLVDSRTVTSGVSFPSRSAASIIATPMRSLTLESGLKYSSLQTICALTPLGIRFRRTSGVFPINSVTLLAIRIRAPYHRQGRQSRTSGRRAGSEGKGLESAPRLPWRRSDVRHEAQRFVHRHLALRQIGQRGRVQRAGQIGLDLLL